jgi:hypothetical protein
MENINHSDILLISNMLDPRAWVRKYLTVASVSWKNLEFTIIGINLIKLSSSAAHIIIQFDLDIAIIDLNSKIDIVKK